MKKFGVLMVFAAFCAGNALAAGAGGSTTVGPGDPSSILCSKLGGVVVALASSDGGEGGFCAFGKAMIGDWTLWHELKGAKTLAVKAFLSGCRAGVSHTGSPGMPNPASVNCEKLGGKVEVYRDRDGGEFGFCELSDRSIIEEWTLFYGPREERNAGLVKVLQEKIK